MTTGNLTIDRVGDFFEVWDKEKQKTVFASEYFGECLDFVFGETDGDMSEEFDD